MSTFIKLFADGADKEGILEMYQNPRIAGFTTNPTLMKKAGITNYVAFAKDLLREIPDKPISFEVFADEFDEMERQALEIADWGQNVYVKIPVMNTKRQTSYKLVHKLSQAGVKLNIIENSRKINEDMPNHVIELIINAFQESNKSLKAAYCNS